MRFVGCYGHQAIAIKMFMLDNMVFLYHSGSVFQFVSSEAWIIKSSFISNSGGSIHDVPLEFTVVDMLWIAISNYYRHAHVGAAIAIAQSNIVISGCVFEGNQAQLGGAVFVEQQSNVTITGTAFGQNYANCHLSRCTSGAIYSGNSTMTVLNSTFYGNKLLVDNNVIELVLLYGGAVGLFESIFIAEHCIFASNGIENASFPIGKYSVGVIYANNTILNISNSAFVNNFNASRGGVMLVSNATCIITKTKFENNSAEDEGGVMHSENSIIVIYESEFKFNFVNSKYGSGGAFTINHTKFNITIMSTLFENNIAYTGGVMTIYKNNNIDIFECNFTRNYARRGGSVLHIMHSWGVNANITITDSLCNENRQFAEHEGGVIDIERGERKGSNASTITIKNTRFIENEGKWGGAVVCSKRTMMILISECDFIGNTAYTGVALYVTKSNVIINGDNGKKFCVCGSYLCSTGGQCFHEWYFHNKHLCTTKRISNYLFLTKHWLSFTPHIS